jgi:hypothetical protein
MIMHAWMPPFPHPPTIANVSASYLGSRFVVIETLFWLYTVRLVAPRIYAGEIAIGWMAASTTVIFLTLTLPAWVLILRARYTPLAFLLAFVAAPAYMLAWKHGIVPL